MRAKQLKTLQAGQGGFTLLELLVVITLIVVLATGALIAYEKLGENAEASAAANSAATIDRAIRTYRSVEGVYPNQWDSLVTINDGEAVPFLAGATKKFIGSWTTTGLDTTSFTNINKALVKAGIEELQFIKSDAVGAENGLHAGVAPNRAHNESTNVEADGLNPAAIETEFEDDGDDDYPLPTYLSVIPNQICAGLGGISLGIPGETLGGDTLTGNEIQNSYADSMESDECHLVVALGFGGDAAASTAFSNVGISQSPTYINNNPNDADNNINPTQHYARFIGLFHIAEAVDTDDDDVPDDWNFNDKAHLVALVSPDGKNIDQLVANSQQQTN